MRRTVALACALALLAVACGIERSDRVELRDGEGFACRVEGFDGQVLRVDTAEGERRLSRAELSAILFETSRKPPADLATTPPDPSRDEVTLRDGNVLATRLAAIDGARVTTRAAVFEREEVFRIRLARQAVGGTGAPDREEEEQEEATARCWAGSVDVERRFRPGQEGGCEQDPLVWKGHARVHLRERPVAAASRRAAVYASDLDYTRIDWKIEQRASTKGCPTYKKHWAAFQDRGRFSGDWPGSHFAARLYHRGESGTERSDPEPEHGERKWRPGQYWLYPPQVCPAREEWLTPLTVEGAARDHGDADVSCQFCCGWGLRVEPGHVPLPREGCPDEARFLADDGALRGEYRCRHEDVASFLQFLEIRWELEPTECER